MSSSENLKKIIADKAISLGFIGIGFSKADLLTDESEHLSTWLESGYDADMKWIGKGFDKRNDVKLILEDAKSVISLAFNYYTPFEHEPSKPKISRYAWGKDYHKVLKAKLKELCEWIECAEPKESKDITNGKGIASLPAKGALPAMTKYYVDDGPVMDKAWAVKAGLGWMGKHTNVINPKHGSWFFICSIIANIDFESYDSPITDLCGECSLCISACPTGAIIDEYVVDSNRCISYQTIENRGEIPDSINLDGWIFGCDVCQDVCPYNSPKHNVVTNEKSFFPKPELYSPLEKGDKGGTKEKISPEFKSKDELEQITEEEFKSVFTDSPIKRTKFEGWKRNLEKY